VSNLKVNDDGSVLVSTCADGTMMLWQATNPFQLLCTYVAMDAGASSMDVGRNIIATGYDDGMIRIWPMMRRDGTFDNEYAHLLLTQESLEKMQSEQASKAKKGSINLAGRKKSPFAPLPQI
jgi:WD40 repeat protein